MFEVSHQPESDTLGTVVHWDVYVMHVAHINKTPDRVMITMMMITT